jgi:hypothetical protein
MQHRRYLGLYPKEMAMENAKPASVPLEQRIRHLGGERAFAIGQSIGAALLRVSRWLHGMPGARYTLPRTSRATHR